MLNRRFELVLVTGLLLIAAVLRLWDLTHLPPGFSDDELVYVRIAETVRQGDVAVYYQVGDGQGRAGLVAIGYTFTTELVGGGLFGFRLLPAYVGLVTLALLYMFARRLFGVEVALVALGVMSINVRAIVLARTATAAGMVPVYLLLVLLVLATALNLRRKITFRAPDTLPFALLALLLGTAGYLHYSLLLVGPLVALFFAHVIYTRQPVSRRVWGAAVFVLVLATVIGTPYLISTLRDTRLSEPHILGMARPRSLADAVDGVLHAVGSLLWQGDPDATHNVPGLPLVGPVIALLLLVGLAKAIRRWRDPRFALLLGLLVAGLLTDAWVRVEATYSASLLALPTVMILPGIGARVIWQTLRARDYAQAGQWVTLGLMLLLAANILVTYVRLDDWRHDGRTRAGFHAKLGYLATYLDRTADDLPVGMCSVPLRVSSETGLPPRQMLRLMLHHTRLPIRHFDCQHGIVLINAGAPMRFVFADVADRALMPPELVDWLAGAQPVPVEGLPSGSVLRLDVEQRVRDAGGQWAALAPAFYMPDNGDNLQPVQLPAQLEQNLTFAGYDPQVLERTPMPGGEPLVLVSYWRVDGPLPPRLGIFAHLLGYTQSTPRALVLEPWAERNSIDVIPSELRARDFFVQVSHIWLSENVPADDYALTVGAYDREVAILENHLDVLDPALDFQPHGDRLLLGTITVPPAPESADAPVGDGGS